uniref:Vinculin n=1 Tax=Macrostomum lignano TaxID=282301 RepID=A0A1I8G859_9PLAT
MPVSAFAAQSSARPVSHGSLASAEPMNAGVSGVGGGSSVGAPFDISNASSRHDLARVGQVGYRVHELPTAQRALITSVQENVGVIQMARNGLDEPDEYVPIGKDVSSRRYLEQKSELSRANISSNLTSASAATADLLKTTTMDDGDDVYMIVGSAVHTIATNVEHILTDVKAVVSLQEQQQKQFGDAGNQPVLDKDSLLNAARNLADAFSDLLNAAQPLDPNTPDRERMEVGRRKRLLDGIDEISGICEYLIGALQEDCAGDASGAGGSEEVAQFREAMLHLAEDVAHQAAQLIGRAKVLTQRLEEPEQQEALIATATSAGINTQRLVATAKIIAPVAQQPACQAQLLEAAKCVTKSVQQLLATASDVAPQSEEPLVEEIAESVQQVNNAVDSLERHIAAGPLTTTHDSAVREIDQVTAALADSSGDSAAMAKYARKAAVHTAQLVASLKSQAEAQKDEAQQRKLLTAAKDLADATAKMIESAKACASQPESVGHQSDLRDAADSLRQLINTVGESVIKSRVIKSLQYASQIAIIAATELVNTAQGAAKKSRASNYQLTQDCKTVAEMIPRLILSVRAVRRDPDDTVAQLELIGSCQHFLPPCQDLINSSRIMQPTVSDGALQRSLNSSINQLQNALKELRTAIDSSNNVVRHMDLDCALEQVRRLQHDLSDLERDLRDGPLLPLPGDSLVDATIQLTQSQKAINQESAGAGSACSEGSIDQCGTRAKELSNRLKDVLESMRSLLAFSSGSAGRQPDEEAAILSDTSRVLDAAHDYIDALRKFSLQPSRPANEQNQLTPEAYKHLNSLRSELADALAALSNHVPGSRQVDNVIQLITQRQHQLQMNPANAVGADSGRFLDYAGLPDGAEYSNLQTDFTSAAVNLNQATGDLVHNSSAGNAQNLVHSTVQFGECYDNFVDTGANLVRATEEPVSRQTLAHGLNHVSDKSNHMLLAAKNAAARLVTESINNMIAVVTCNEESAEERVCDSVLNRLQSIPPAVQQATRNPASSDGYYPSLSGIIGQTESLAESMSEIARCSVDGNAQGFCQYAQIFGESVYKVAAYHAAQCVYLVGVADPMSVPGRRPVIDADLIKGQLDEVRTACASVRHVESDNKPIYRTAQIIAKAAGAIVSHCKSAKGNSSGSETIGRRVVQLAKDVALETSNLVNTVREMENDFEKLKPHFNDQAAKLCEAIEKLYSLAGGSECAGYSAQVSDSGLRAQEPLIACTDRLTEAAILLIKAARHLSARRNDSRMYESYSSSSKAVSDAVKLLVTVIRDMAPGRKEISEAIDSTRSAQQQLRNLDLDGRANLGSHQHGDGSNPCMQQMSTSASYIVNLLPAAEAAALAEPETLAHSVTNMSSYLTALKDACIGSQQCAPPQEQEALFDQTKTVLEAAEGFLEACHQTGGNPEVGSAARDALRESREILEDACRELLDTLAAAVASGGDYSFLTEAIEKDMDRVEAPYGDLAASASLNLVDFQTRIVRICADIRRTHQDLCAAVSTEGVADAGQLHQLAEQYRALVAEARGAMATCRSADTERRMSRALLAIGRDCLDTAQLHSALPSAEHADRLVMQVQPQLAEHLAELLSPLQASHRGTQACINAANTVSGIISDLDTTIMFASAGTLNAFDRSTFTEHSVFPRKNDDSPEQAHTSHRSVQQPY